MKKTKNELLKAFEDLSSIITGFTKADLTATGLLEIYFNTVEKELGEQILKNLLVNFLKIKVNNIDELSKEEHSNINELINNIKSKQFIDQIIKLWYLGEWINNNDSYIISSQSYLEGLIWKAIAAHPMGGKQPGYGTWGFPPLTFSSNTKNN